MHQFVGGDSDLGVNALFYFNLSDTHDLLPFTLNSTGHLSISRDIDLEIITNRQCDLPHYFVCTKINLYNLLTDHCCSLPWRLLIMVRLKQLIMLGRPSDISTSQYVTSTTTYHDSQTG